MGSRRFHEVTFLGLHRASAGGAAVIGLRARLNVGLRRKVGLLTNPTRQFDHHLETSIPVRITVRAVGNASVSNASTNTALTEARKRLLLGIHVVRLVSTQ